MQWNQIEFKFAEIETTPNVRSSDRPLYGGFINHNQRSLPGHVLPPLDFLKTSHLREVCRIFRTKRAAPVLHAVVALYRALRASATSQDLSLAFFRAQRLFQ